MKVRLTGFILALTLAFGLLALPLPAEAQQAGKVYRIGVLESAFRSFALGRRGGEGR